jgi:hypothetical protein
MSSSAIHNTALNDMLLRCLAPGSRASMLISGGSDATMLELLVAFCREHAIDGNFSALDRCPTPLSIMETAAAQLGTPLTTFCGDILEVPLDAGFDVIITHAFLGYFPAAGRTAVARRWANWLNPGGHVITVQRIRPGAGGEEPIGFTPDQAQDLMARVRGAFSDQGITDGAEQTAIEESVRGFTARFAAYPVRSREELAALFTGAGLVLELLEPLPSSAQRPAEQGAGPSVPGSADYVQVIARKP